MQGKQRWIMAALAAGVLATAMGRASVAQQVDGTVVLAPAATPDAATDKTEGKDDAPLGERSDREVGIGEQLSFREQQVKAEMSELEQRMFRLSEALKKLEPENSSRLIIGLKYARDELILHQMQEIQRALAKLSLQGAIDEQKQLMAKLERLEQLLLSTDLDFEMRLQRLRMIRETIRRLDTVIKEESREEKISKKSAETEKNLAKLAERKAAIEALIKQQAEHIEKNTPLAKSDSLSQQQQDEAAKLGEAQQATQQATEKLAAEPVGGASSKNLSARPAA